MWPLEFIGLTFGFYLTSKFEFGKVSRYALVGLIGVFTVAATYQVASYDFDQNTTQQSIAHSTNEAGDSSRFKLIQLTTKYCGQCIPHTKFLAQFLEQSETRYPLQCVYMTYSSLPEDSIKGYEKTMSLIEQGGEYLYDGEGSMCKQYGIEAFPALIIIDKQTQKRFTILGFAGDMRYAYTKKLKAILAGEYNKD